jgi:hypothetical protein
MMKTTEEFFKMTVKELEEKSHDNGRTIEECKLFNEADVVVFLSNVEQFNNIGVDHELFMKMQGMSLEENLIMIDGRVALLYRRNK